MLSEFELIGRYFSRPARGAVLGVGDDAALVRPGASSELAVTTDMLVEGVHFLRGADARSLGHKSLAVNLSDLAAMGATPRWATLAIALPAPDEAWLAAFSAGLYALAERTGVELVGGDTARAPTGGALTISITLLGEVPAGTALLRSGARPGDDIWVSGELGGAALGLAYLQGRVRLPDADAREAVRRLNEPEPRLDLGRALRGIATAAIDVSDGFAGDLAHIVERSAAGAAVEYDALPRASAFARIHDARLERGCVLSGGDDYELVFTAPPERRAAIERIAAGGPALTRVGSMQAERALRIVDARGVALERAGGFDHFAR